MTATTPTPLFGPIAHAVKATLDHFGYKHIINKKGTSVIFDVVTPGPVVWRSQGVIYESSKVLELNVFATDEGYREDRERWVLELACRATNTFPTGAFAFRWGYGDVRYRTCLSFGQREVNNLEVEELLNSTAFPLRVWHDAFQYRHAKVTPEAALNAALIRLDGYEQETVSNATRRALLTVEKSKDGAVCLEPLHIPSPTLTLI